MTGKRNSAHRQAQRKYPAEKCERCGGTRTLQRHHQDRNPHNNEEMNVEVLCQKCHTAEHMARGDWGCGPVLPRPCVICGETYQPDRKKRGKLCPNPECLREMGRRSAAKRWHGENTSLGLPSE